MCTPLTFVLDESEDGTDQPTVAATPRSGADTLTHDYSVNFGAVTLATFGTDGPEGGTVAARTGYKFALSGSGIGSGLYVLEPSDVLSVAGDLDGIGQGSQIQLYGSTAGCTNTV